MPKMVTLVPNDLFKPSNPEEKKAFESLKPHKVSYVQARENMRKMRGMLVAQEEEDRAEDPQFVPLEQRSIDELKVMMVSLGVKTEKQMSKAEIVKTIRSKLDAIEVTDA